MTVDKNSEPIIWDHVLHCIEAVRQGLSCFLDPTLINMEPGWPGIPDGQLHVCRNKDALKKFATEHQYQLGLKPSN